jgi:hypothetical protein
LNYLLPARMGDAGIEEILSGHVEIASTWAE